MKAGRLLSMGFACLLSATLSVAAGATPLHSAALRDFVAGPCAPGGTYDPACDANQDGQITIADIQLTAGHWNQTGTWLSDNNHDHLDQDWTGDGNGLTIQGSFPVYPDAPLMLSNSTGNGSRVQSAGKAGVYVVSSVDDGLWVCRAGNTSPCESDFNSNGVDVGSAEDYGIRVELAGRSSFRSDASGTNGLYIYDAGDSGVWVRAATNWAGYFTGNINVTGSCTGCLIAQMAVNSGDETLQPGDIVSVKGIAESPFDNVAMLLRACRAAPGNPLVGVVSGRAQPVISSEDGSETLAPRVGEPAAPGDYLSVVIYGPVQVKAAGDVQLGDRVTTADASAGVRALSAFQVQRTDGAMADMLETAPVLGIALEEAKDGMVWVLVNPQ